MYVEIHQKRKEKKEREPTNSHEVELTAASPALSWANISSISFSPEKSIHKKSKSGDSLTPLAFTQQTG